MTATELINKLRARGMSVATAESCTGGLLAAALTDIPGASYVYGYGLVTYGNRAKTSLLGVAEETLAAYGAVSEQTARAMAAGLLRVSGAALALATTGVAGPDGGSAEKPVGLVYIAAAVGEREMVRRCQFSGSRGEVRRSAVAAALELGIKILTE